MMQDRRFDLAARACSATLGKTYVMTFEETAILTFLSGSPEAFVARREIARKALKRTIFEENPHWADAALSGLVDQHLVEQDEGGHYRINRQGN
jgi:hypothetical protein